MVVFCLVDMVLDIICFLYDCMMLMDWWSLYLEGEISLVSCYRGFWKCLVVVLDVNLKVFVKLLWMCIFMLYVIFFIIWVVILCIIFCRFNGSCFFVVFFKVCILFWSSVGNVIFVKIFRFFLFKNCRFVFFWSFYNLLLILMILVLNRFCEWCVKKWFFWKIFLWWKM